MVRVNTPYASLAYSQPPPYSPPLTTSISTNTSPPSIKAIDHYVVTVIISNGKDILEDDQRGSHEQAYFDALFHQNFPSDRTHNDDSILTLRSANKYWLGDV